MPGEVELQENHRKLGRELGLFMFSSEVGPGLPLWLPKGAILRDTLERFLRQEQLDLGYLPVVTLHIGKLDFLFHDALGRQWQLGTAQVDYNLPERFDLGYIGDDGQPHKPVMIHRANFGSLERLIGILLEHHGGAFPAWLDPSRWQSFQSLTGT